MTDAAPASPSAPRRATLTRETKETQVAVTIDLDGEGADVRTSNRFLDHMLETWARYAGIRVEVTADGDLDHHLVEDVAITCGQAFRKAFGGAPCVRIAHDLVPMDDALVQVAVDLVDRPFYDGELPLPIFEHWFRSFATEARINLHIVPVRGRDPHHLVEASFKGFGRALRAALAPRTEELSMKGTVRTEDA